MTREQIAHLLGIPFQDLVEDSQNPELLRLILNLMYQHGIKEGMTLIFNDYNTIFKGS